MKFERLRLSGFKTFVEPVEIAIAPGLTGIVGPNGCGKSNLVEALRWAMGETSSKSLRGAGMEDVIFAGSSTRAERNNAEVSLRISEPPEDLPGHLAGADTLEISRRIVREQGSTYRINGREVRARDVQILFADAASGARSPSLVRQGQISELIAAKPQHRRRILEDAAGVAGLHTRRHEAELRLKNTEDNLARLGDILLQYDRQRGDLRRQARQAERYKALSAQIRELDIALLAAGHASAQAQAEQARAAHDAARRTEAMALVAQGEAERARGVAEHAADAARRALSEAQARHTRLSGERVTLDAELAQTHLRLNELAQRRAEARNDAETATQTRADAVEALARLGEERDALLARGDAMAQEISTLEAQLARACAARIEAEAVHSSRQQQVAEARAQRRTEERRLADAEARTLRLEGLGDNLEREVSGLRAADSPLAGEENLATALTNADSAVQSALSAQRDAELAVQTARAEEQTARPRLAEAERLVQRLETELRTIRKLVDNTQPGLWTPAVDRIDVAQGFERALAAALGDDLDAAIEPGAPRHWATCTLAALPSLPAGAECLLAHVKAPGALSARLSQIGVVTAEHGEVLAAALQPGQRLVSKEGDLWRWDGFSSRAEAPSPAARRMAERNRLTDLQQEAEKGRQKRDTARTVLEQALRLLRTAQDAEGQARDGLRHAQRARDAAAQALAQAKSASEGTRIREQAALARLETLAGEIEEARREADAARGALTALEPAEADAEVDRIAFHFIESARHAESEAQGALSRHLDAKANREARLCALERDISAWEARAERAKAGESALEARLARLESEEAALAGVPDQLAARRLSLNDDIDSASQTANRAGEDAARMEAESRLSHEAARTSVSKLADARAERARLEVLDENASARLAEITAAIETRLGVPVSSLPPPDSSSGPFSDPQTLQMRLDDLQAERDRLGAVNLRAEIELCEIEKEHERLILEKADVEKAIAKLRRAIDQLNAEGRARLRNAFEKVDAAFRQLFTRLFGGGTAQLQLVEADDPLDAGLEILAHPPGKKPQLLSLLSGGEQALTATALIFAVFLTNPSPICVLDEVDAPLDDANVERLCALLADMARETRTRFLVITHNPISMAHMDRLYGVTMIERGVSQVVSVDLVTAEGLAEAG